MVRRELSQAVSDRPSDRRSDGSDCRASDTAVAAATPAMTDEDVRLAFRSVEQELERLRTQHVTHRKSVRIDPSLERVRRVPLPDSDTSRSPSPVQHTSPSMVMQRARNSGQFSPADLRLFQDAFDAAASLSTPKDNPREGSFNGSRGFNIKLHPYDGTSKLFETFIARFENFSDHFQWNENDRLFNLRNSLAKSVDNVLWDSGSPSSSAQFIQLDRKSVV